MILCVFVCFFHSLFLLKKYKTDSLNERTRTRAHRNGKVPLFLICPNDALNCMAIHLSFLNMICWHTKCWFGTHKHTKDTLYYSTILSFYRPCPMMTIIACSIKKNTKSSTSFETDCACVCSRTFEHIRKDKTNSCQLRFAFSVICSHINWAHPYNHRGEKSVYLTYFPFCYLTWAVMLLVSHFAHTHLPSLFFRIGKWSKIEAKMTYLFCYLMEKPRYFTFSNKISTIFLALMELCLIAISTSTERCRMCSHTIIHNLLNVFSNHWQNIYIASSSELLVVVVSDAFVGAI